MERFCLSAFALLILPSYHPLLWVEVHLTLLSGLDTQSTFKPIRVPFDSGRAVTVKILINRPALRAGLFHVVPAEVFANRDYLQPP